VACGVRKCDFLIRSSTGVMGRVPDNRLLVSKDSEQDTISPENDNSISAATMLSTTITSASKDDSSYDVEDTSILFKNSKVASAVMSESLRILGKSLIHETKESSSRNMADESYFKKLAFEYKQNSFRPPRNEEEISRIVFGRCIQLQLLIDSIMLTPVYEIGRSIFRLFGCNRFVVDFFNHSYPRSNCISYHVLFTYEIIIFSPQFSSYLHVKF
jgi:hypothetical protein